MKMPVEQIAKAVNASKQQVEEWLAEAPATV